MNVNIHDQWASLFTLHMNSKSQLLTYNNASSYNSNSNNEEIHCTPINSKIHNFFDAPKNWIMKTLYILLPQVKTFAL